MMIWRQLRAETILEALAGLLQARKRGERAGAASGSERRPTESSGHPIVAAGNDLRP